MTGRQRSSAGGDLRDLLEAFLNGGLTANEFSRRFETAYNLDTDREALTTAEQTSFERLFDAVVWYSPFPDERAVIPHYKSEAQIEQAAKVARSELG